MAKSCWRSRSQSWDWGVFSWKLAGFAFLLEEGGKELGTGGCSDYSFENRFKSEQHVLFEGMKHQSFDASRHVMFYFIPKDPRWPCNPQTKKTSFWEADQTSHFSENVRSPREKLPVGWLVLFAQLPRFVENPAKAQVPQELLLLKLMGLLWPYLMARFGRSSGSITVGFCAGESFLLT